MKKLRGLTWKHLRAVDSLRISSLVYSQRHDVEIVWDIRDLSKFEHQPMEEIVRIYDMIVYDHPFSGILSTEHYFKDLSVLSENSMLNPSAYIGASLESYYYKGQQWGIPIDGATNHAIYREDILKDFTTKIPKSWGEVCALGKKMNKKGARIGMAVKGHHGLLIVAALCANLGAPWSTNEDIPFVIDKNILQFSVQLVKDMIAYSNEEAVEWNSIDLHNAMIARDDIVFCPCVYGFAVYGEDYIYPKKLSFGNFTGYKEPFYNGSVLGGTAIGISEKSAYTNESIEYLVWLSNPETQKNILSAHHGQAARIEVWEDEEIDKQYNKFYSSIRKSMETAWMRPRFVGYQNFEHRAGNILESFLRNEISEKKVVNDIIELSQKEFIAW